MCWRGMIWKGKGKGHLLGKVWEFEFLLALLQIISSAPEHKLCCQSVVWLQVLRFSPHLSTTFKTTM